MKMKIVFYSTRDFERPFFESLNYDSHDIVYLRQTLTKETVEMSNGADAIFVFPNDDCSKEIIESLHQLGVKYISTRSKGFDHIDWARANELGVIVGRVPDYSPFSVITSHQGSLTEKAMEDIARASFHNVGCWSKGNKSGNELN